MLRGTGAAKSQATLTEEAAALGLLMADDTTILGIRRRVKDPNSTD
jgi:hypothetical protein